MKRKLLALAFLLALCWMPLGLAPQAAVPGAQVGGACTAHVCYICAQSGLVCVAKPYCHCE
jgi:hypothetical protein